MSYNITDSNINDPTWDKLDPASVPDVILVKKHYGDKSARRRQRNWKLKHLAEDATNLDVGHSDYHEFLDDLEEDPAYRQHVNIFRDTSKQVMDVTDELDDDPSVPRITLEEMLDDLHLEDAEMTEEPPKNPASE